VGVCPFMRHLFMFPPSFFPWRPRPPCGRYFPPSPGCLFCPPITPARKDWIIHFTPDKTLLPRGSPWCPTFFTLPAFPPTEQSHAFPEVRLSLFCLLPPPGANFVFFCPRYVSFIRFEEQLFFSPPPELVFGFSPPHKICPTVGGTFFTSFPPDVLSPGPQYVFFSLCSPYMRLVEAAPRRLGPFFDFHPPHAHFDLVWGLLSF